MKGTGVFCVLLVLYITISHSSASPAVWRGAIDPEWLLWYKQRKAHDNAKGPFKIPEPERLTDEQLDAILKGKGPIKVPGYPQDQLTAGPGPWSQWTACSTSCDGGTRQRTRSCIIQETLQPCSDENNVYDHRKRPVMIRNVQIKSCQKMP